MSSSIETTVKALVEFESELDKAKTSASEAKRRTAKDASDWAEDAKASAISKAQEAALGMADKAREEAEESARKIREKAASDLKAFESSISRHKSKAADLAASRLLGGSD